MVAPTKGIADRRVALRGEILCQPHGNLAWASNLPRTLFGKQIGNLDLEVVSRPFLNVCLP